MFRSKTGVAILLLAGLTVSACRTRLLELDVLSPPTEPDALDASLDASLDNGQGSFDHLDLVFSPDGPHICEILSFQNTARATPDLLILQDRSGSMNNGINDNRNPPPGQSKWDLIRAALEQVVTTPGDIDWGLMMFGTDRMCGAPTVPDVDIGADTGAAIKQVLDDTTPQSSTPTTVTIDNAVAYYKTLADQHPHYLVLATDGEPTCGHGGGPMGADDVAAEQAVANAAAAGIDTYVIGIGNNTGAEKTLGIMAMNGRVPNTAAGESAYFSVNSTNDLVSVLDGIAGRLGTCTYPLDHIPENESLVSVQASIGLIPRDQTHTNGWDFGPGELSINLYGDVCERVRGGIVINLEAIYQCPLE